MTNDINSEHQKIFVSIFFIFFLVFNTTVLWSQAETHFQEVDSSISLELLQPQERKIIKFVRTSYTAQDWSSKDKKSGIEVDDVIGLLPKSLLAEVISWPQIEALLAGRLDYERLLNAEDLGAEITAQVKVKYPELSSLSVHAYYRVAQSVLIERFISDARLKGLIEYPLASTYTPMMGLYYFSIYAFCDNSGEFYGLSVKSNLLLANIGLFLLFLTLLKNNIHPTAAAAACLVLAYSVSFYQYAFHLGSTIHTFFALCLAGTILFGLTKNFSSRWKAMILALLISYSYMIVIPLVAIYANTFLVRAKAGDIKSIFGALFSSINYHKYSIATVIVFIAIFFTPGQGIRGEMESFLDAPEYFYLVILNLFGWSNTVGSTFIKIQAVIILLILVVALCRNALLKSILNNQSARLLALCFLTYGVLLIIGMLSFTPTRHILFLQPLLVPLIALGFEQMRHALPLSPTLTAKLLSLCGMVLVGSTAQRPQLQATEALHLNIEAPSNYHIAISDTPTVFESWLGRPVENITAEMSKVGTTTKDNTILFVSSSLTFDDIQRLRVFDLDIIEYDAVTLFEKESKVKFLPFESPRFNDGRFAFNRANSLYIYLLKPKELCHTEAPCPVF